MIALGFSLQPQYALPTERIIELLAEFGFSAVSPVWSPELDLENLAACTKTCGMSIQSLHAPHRGIPLLWTPDAPGSAAVQSNMLRCIDDCARFHIPVMVLHCWQGLDYVFPEEPLDYRFFDTLAEYARQKGICIALENLEGEEYLDALMTRYRALANIGFCWDSGHDHCYPHRLDFLKQYGHRLIMTHINDNLGIRDSAGIPSSIDDLHYLPYDGNIPWEQSIHRLAAAPRQTILNFEFKISTRNPADLIYTQLSPEEFLQTAARRARKIARLYENIISG